MHPDGPLPKFVRQTPFTTGRERFLRQRRWFWSLGIGIKPNLILHFEKRELSMLGWAQDVEPFVFLRACP